VLKCPFSGPAPCPFEILAGTLERVLVYTRIKYRSFSMELLLFGSGNDTMTALTKENHNIYL
jgi:hypothetical protein